MKIFGLYIETRKEREKTVAVECYGLTHEFTTTMLMRNHKDGRFTGYTDAAYLQLDREMKAFVATKGG